MGWDSEYTCVGETDRPNLAPFRAYPLLSVVWDAPSLAPLIVQHGPVPRMGVWVAFSLTDALD